jgi:hypothetical protein
LRIEAGDAEPFAADLDGIEAVEVANVKNDAVTFGNGAFVERFGFQNGEQAVTFATGKA